MREILFKAKSIATGEWVEGSLLQTTAVSLKSFIVESSCYTFDKWDWNECVQVDTNTICQYTGLTDKNGNKIWENDVIKDSDGDIGNIKYGIEGTAAFIVHYGHKFEYILLGEKNIDSLKIEVNGNVFDNPELIGE